MAKNEDKAAQENTLEKSINKLLKDLDAATKANDDMETKIALARLTTLLLKHSEGQDKAPALSMYVFAELSNDLLYAFLSGGLRMMAASFKPNIVSK